MTIREERADDTQAVRALNLAAFQTSTEADLVDALRVEASPFVSLVAEESGVIVGHIMFSPVNLALDAPLLMGLAPMAVSPERQRQGIGSRLIAEGLERCGQLGAAVVVVLGHADYYPRFGFAPASRFGLRSEYDVPDEVFMARELKDGGLEGLAGTVRYHPVFARF